MTDSVLQETKNCMLCVLDRRQKRPIPVSKRLVECSVRPQLAFTPAEECSAAVTFVCVAWVLHAWSLS